VSISRYIIPVPNCLTRIAFQSDLLKIPDRYPVRKLYTCRSRTVFSVARHPRQRYPPPHRHAAKRTRYHSHPFTHFIRFGTLIRKFVSAIPFSRSNPACNPKRNIVPEPNRRLSHVIPQFPPGVKPKRINIADRIRFRI